MISAFSALQISALQNVAFTEMLYDFFFFFALPISAFTERAFLLYRTLFTFRAFCFILLKSMPDLGVFVARGRTRISTNKGQPQKGVV